MRLNQRHNILGYLSAFLSAALFGSISVIAKPALGNVSPIMLSSLVYLLAFALLTPVVRVNKIREGKANAIRLDRNQWLLIISIAVAGAIIAPTLYFVGLVDAKASDTALLSNAEVVFTVLIAIAIFRERFTRRGYFAIIAVIAGAIIVTTNLDFGTLFTATVGSKGTILILLAMAFWAIDNNLSKLATRQIEVARLVQLKSLIGGSVLMLIVFVSGTSLSGVTVSNLPNVLFLGIGGVGASLFFFLQSIKRIGTIRTMMIYCTSAIFGLTLSAIFLGESIGVYQVSAAVLMLVGIYFIETSYDPRNSSKTSA